MVGEALGLPDPCTTFRPATAPESACEGLENMPVVRLSFFTLAMEFVIFERMMEPL